MVSLTVSSVVCARRSGDVSFTHAPSRSPARRAHGRWRATSSTSANGSSSLRIAYPAVFEALHAKVHQLASWSPISSASSCESRWYICVTLRFRKTTLAVCTISSHSSELASGAVRSWAIAARARLRLLSRSSILRAKTPIACGCSARSRSKPAFDRRRSSLSTSVATQADRGAPESSAISPSDSPGPTSPSGGSLPSSRRVKTRSLPEDTK